MAFTQSINTGITPNDGKGAGLRTNMRVLIANDLYLKGLLDVLNTQLQGITFSLDKDGNVLKFKKGENILSEIDLSVYLDDTNLSRITSGNLDPDTFIATFLRDDGSKFTIDFSALSDLKNVGIAELKEELKKTDVVIPESGVISMMSGIMTEWTTLTSNRNISFTDLVQAKVFTLRIKGNVAITWGNNIQAIDIGYEGDKWNIIDFKFIGTSREINYWKIDNKKV